MMKKIALLGSTGSIGQSTLQVARHLQHEIQIVAIAGKSNIDLLEQQAHDFSPQIIAVYDEQKALELKKRLPGKEILSGMEGLEAVASCSDANFVISAIAGTLGLAPTIAAIKSGKNIGLANKEALVSGGSLVMSLAKKNNVEIIPIDSEHSAIFQCLQGQDKTAISRIILTASGGPFRNFSNDQLKKITVEQALRHPNWQMGPKVTIDSSTLMNKGLEAIEAHWLFDMPIGKIEVIIHPQSIIHSMVEFADGSLLAQMGEPKMIVPIQYAITYPKRLPGLLPKFDLIKNGNLQFFSPDVEKFPCLKLAFDAIKEGGSLPCYLNTANEILVDQFISKKITWQEIGNKLERLVSRHQVRKVNSLDDIHEIDKQARVEAAKE